MPKTSRSWGHSIRALEEAERVRVPFGSREDPEDVTCTRGIKCPGVQEQTTRYSWKPEGITSRVGGPAVFEGTYAYVTGRAGRVSRKQLPLCQSCGEKFAANHGLTLPGEEPAVVIDLMKTLQDSLASRRTPTGQPHASEDET